MKEQRFNYLVNALNEFEGVEEIFLLNKEGDVVFKSGDFPLSSEEAKAILNSWKEKEPALVFQNYRFAILKNDEIQLAAKNIGAEKVTL